jgi:hypothetical protein
VKLLDRHRRLFKVLNRVFQVLVVGLTLAYVARALVRNWDQVTALDVRVGWRHGAALVLGIAYLWVRGLIWHDLVRKVVGDVPVRINVACWLASQLGKYVPGKVMLVLGRVLVYKRRGLSVTRVASGFVLEMLALFSTAALFTTLAPFFGDWPLPWFLQWASGVAFVLLTGLCHPRWLALAERLLRRFGIRATEVPTYRFRDALGWIAMMTADWLILGLGLFLLADTIVPLEPALFVPLTAAFALAGTAGIAVLVAPSGLGVREGVLTLLLTPVLGPGPSAVLAIMARLWSTAAEVASALVALPLLRQASLTHEPAGAETGVGDAENAP